MEESTAPTLSCVRHIRSLLHSAARYLSLLKKENITDSVVDDDKLDCHYLQLENYIARAQDKVTGTIHHIERNKPKEEQNDPL